MNTRNTKRRFDSDSDSDYEPPLKVSKNEIKKDNDKDDDKDGIFWIYELDLGDDRLFDLWKFLVSYVAPAAVFIVFLHVLGVFGVFS